MMVKCTLSLVVSGYSQSILHPTLALNTDGVQMFKPPQTGIVASVSEDK